MSTKIGILLASIWMLAGGSAHSAALATFEVDPPVTAGQPDQLISIRVHVASAEDIGALQFTLDYDSSVLTYQSVVLHASMPLGFSITNVNTNLPPPEPQTPGTDENVLIQISGNGINQSFTGEQDVAVVTFRIPSSACGDSPLAFDTSCQRTHLSTIELLPICNPSLVGGEVTTGCATDAPPVHESARLRLRNAPNPFNPSTTIRFELPEPGAVRLHVFDVQGRTVRVLLDRFLGAGPHVVEWNGADDAGRSGVSGTYYYRLSTPSGTATRRMLMLK